MRLQGASALAANASQTYSSSTVSSAGGRLSTLL
jgi:hypothetical protein